MKDKNPRYGNLFLFSTLQFTGYYPQFFIENSQKAAVIYMLPRLGRENNFLEIYKSGNLISRKKLFSPRNIILYYISIYIHYLTTLFTYFKANEQVIFINHQPYFLFLNSIVRKLRKMTIIYWILDYYPMKDNFKINIFRWLVHYYHKRSKITLYVSDRINEVMNGKVIAKPHKKTVMLGMNPPEQFPPRKIKNIVELCFIGQIVEAQGIDLLLSVVAQMENVNLKLIGTGEGQLIEKYKNLVKKYHIEAKVFFPNRFYYGKELYGQVKDCHIGMALYVVDKNTITYYADPAKIKQYAELGLPIIMTNAAGIATYLTRFQAGVVVGRNIEVVENAIMQIKKQYALYTIGLAQFNEHFNYRTYYDKAFAFLEKRS